MQQQQQQQQDCSREMASTNPLQQLQNNQQQHHEQIPNPQIQQHQSSHFDQPSHDDLFDRMISTLPSWPEILSNPKSPLFSLISQTTKLRDLSDDPDNNVVHHFPYDDSSLLASRLRQHQISGNPSPLGKPILQQQQQQQLLSRSPSSSAGGDHGLLPLPLTLGSSEPSDSAADGSVQALYSNRFSGSLSQSTQTAIQEQFHHPQAGSILSQNYGAGAGAAGIIQAPATGSAGGGTVPVRQRVRARRGQATDPHSIAERLRRERIAERMKALQELVPNANKTDKASMLDEIIDYVKFLQLQVKVLSMSRLGGATAVAPLVADISSEAGRMGRSGNGAQTASSNDSIAVTEHQVAKMMEEDMGSAMQYLQGKGLCLMPISLASAISTATSHPRALFGGTAGADAPSSPSMSVLTAQSALGNGGETDGSLPSVKDAASVSKP